jgi:hypothetical protein
MTGKKGICKAAHVASFTKKGSSLALQAGEVRTGRKPHLTRKKK